MKLLHCQYTLRFFNLSSTGIPQRSAAFLKKFEKQTAYGHQNFTVCFLIKFLQIFSFLFNQRAMALTRISLVPGKICKLQISRSTSCVSVDLQQFILHRGLFSFDFLFF